METHHYIKLLKHLNVEFLQGSSDKVLKVGDYSFSTYRCDIIRGGVLVCERN